MPDPSDPYTLAAHLGQSPATGAQPVSPPIYQTSTFMSDDADAFQAMATEPLHPTFYTRYGNPTTQAFADAVAALEGAEAGLAMASGMGALATAILSFVRNGEHIVAQRALYGGTVGFLNNIAPRLGIDVTFVDQTSAEAFARAATPSTRLILLESPSNPLLRLTDLAAVAADAKARGIVTLADNTIASPINQQPVASGIDLVMHSATKYLAGHSDVSAGVVVGRKALIREVWEKACLFGATLDPFAAWLGLRGVRSLPLRVERQNGTGLQLARFLADHPAVEAVHYPGLDTHPQHRLARRQMRGFGGVLSFEVRGGAAAAETVVARLRLARRSASFGSFSTLVVHPAAMWSGMMSEEQLRAVDLPPGLIRLGAGLEDPAALQADLDRALASID